MAAAPPPSAAEHVRPRLVTSRSELPSGRRRVPPEVASIERQGIPQPPELRQGRALDLTDPIASHAQSFADLLEGPGVLVQAVTQPQHAGLVPVHLVEQLGELIQ